MKKISVIAIYADEKTSQSGISNWEETLETFDQFPWKQEIEKSKQTGVAPMISTFSHEENDSYMNYDEEIMTNEDGSFMISMEVVHKKGVFGSFFEKKAELNLDSVTKEQVNEYIQNFFHLSRRKLLKKLDRKMKTECLLKKISSFWSFPFSMNIFTCYKKLQTISCVFQTTRWSPFKKLSIVDSKRMEKICEINRMKA